MTHHRTALALALAAAVLLPAFAPAADFDGDGSTDIAVFRPASGFWAVRELTRAYLGTGGDLPTAADYNGDGTGDIAVFRPASGRWAVRNATRFYLGRAGDLAIPGDYNGDGTEEGAVFRRSSTLWAVRGMGQMRFGSPYDFPIAGDYNGDGAAERAIYRPETGFWAVAGYTRFVFGAPGDYLILDDFDADGAEEGGVYRPSSGLWAVKDLTRIYLGGSSDLPQPGDFSGGGPAASGIFRPSTGLWVVQGLTRAYLGKSGDIPVSAPYFLPVAPDPPFGIETVRPHEDSYYLGLVASAGATWTRKNHMSWRRVEPVRLNPASYYWEVYDAALRAIAENGLKPVLIISDLPDWVSSTRCGPIPAAFLPDFADFLAAAVRRYAFPPFNIKHWELFNEPDGTSEKYGATINCWGYHGDQYAEMLKTAYPAITSADPDSRVVLGGLAYDWFTDAGGIFYRDFIVDVLEHGGGDYFDIMNFHYYYYFVDQWSPYGRDIMGKAAYLQSVLESHGVSKPLICSETALWGYDNAPDLDRQASYVVQVNVRGIAFGLEKVIWFLLVDDYTNPQSSHMGLVEETLAPKPSFTAFSALTRELAGHIFGWTLGVDETGSELIEGYAFVSRASGKVKKVLWATKTVGMRFDNPRIRVADKLGTAWVIEDNGPGDYDVTPGVIMIPIVPSPVYVETYP